MPDHFLGEKRPLVGPTGMHDDHGSPLDVKIYMRPTYVQDLDYIKIILTL